MIKEGRVNKINNKNITVLVDECPDCGDCTMCSSGKSKQTTISFNCDLSLEVGDLVSFEIPDGALIKFSMLIYIIPLVFFFLGYIVSSFLFKSEGFRIIISFLSLAISFLFLYIFDYYKGKKFIPHNIKKL